MRLSASCLLLATFGTLAFAQTPIAPIKFSDTRLDNGRASDRAYR